MTHADGTKLGPYVISREIGRGGMGVVYLARDTKLDRDVAIKALPEEFAADLVRLERFEREAKSLAHLNHPNIAGIHGVEEQEGQRYLILEYVEGETLGERLDRGPISVDEAVEIAIGIALGVEAAHEAGVIHRDLKPDNIKITPEGKVKVLDFGLAKSEEASSSTVHADSPTPTTPPLADHCRRDPRHRCLHDPRGGSRTQRRQAHRHLVIPHHRRRPRRSPSSRTGSRCSATDEGGSLDRTPGPGQQSPQLFKPRRLDSVETTVLHSVVHSAVRLGGNDNDERGWRTF